MSQCPDHKELVEAVTTLTVSTTAMHQDIKRVVDLMVEQGRLGQQLVDLIKDFDDFEEKNKIEHDTLFAHRRKVNGILFVGFVLMNMAAFFTVLFKEEIVMWAFR